MTLPFPPSRRGEANLSRGRLIDFNRDLEGKPLYHPISNPHGLIDISGASNEGMRDYLQQYCDSKWSDRSISSFLKYGPVAGPPDLQNAVSTLINEWFHPAIPIQPSQVLATNGVSSLIDMVAFNIAEAGEGMLIPVPMYSMFEQGVCARDQLTILPVQTGNIPDQFSAVHKDAFIAEFQKSLDAARHNGITVRAVLISNPNNPVGRFYSRPTLEALAHFCTVNGLHLVADEIYALSGFPSPDDHNLPGFTSVLSLRESSEPGKLISHQNIHCLYGASKDWAMAGLRLGFLITRNPELWETCRRLALFTWVTPFATKFFTEFLSNPADVRRYVTLNRERLRAKYISTTSLMRERGVPFTSANGGLFIWIDLSAWLCHFPGHDDPRMPGETREMQLCKYLIKEGVYLSMGELSFAPSPGHFRFVYTSPGDESQVAVQRIADACEKLDTGSEWPSVRSIER
ncbi:hypothetical protein ASPBRDRAFT_62811 [Aspergillus brasiliensis CBS 101740]|uniref:Aminotransferase class I/classII large domain-containing protein n=1 Tax=Aspergillus brasiliensis (strain CBS 101740 / IMI 381727 / IBT 21946) TaxID=767769 RepID=A0A1L9UYE5_ASPBC|nr:hypothetical protein ASPBRDRAFT_62811 [Aspergillus brasiliensis CBS 101740]